MRDWMERGMYLPPIMRDFHDQKMVFKLIDVVVGNAQNKAKEEDSASAFMTKRLPPWTTAHIYVIDFFLWFMAKRGYTLQRSRQKFDFIDIQDDISAYRKKEADEFKTYMMERREARERQNESL